VRSRSNLRSPVDPCRVPPGSRGAGRVAAVTAGRRPLALPRAARRSPVSRESRAPRPGSGARCASPPPRLDAQSAGAGRADPPGQSARTVSSRRAPARPTKASGESGPTTTERDRTRTRPGFSTTMSASSSDNHGVRRTAPIVADSPRARPRAPRQRSRARRSPLGRGGSRRPGAQGDGRGQERPTGWVGRRTVAVHPTRYGNRTGVNRKDLPRELRASAPSAGAPLACG